MVWYAGLEDIYLKWRGIVFSKQAGGLPGMSRNAPGPLLWLDKRGSLEGIWDCICASVYLVGGCCGDI